MTLNNQRGITYYRQIADVLIGRIYREVYRPGEKIPSGRELSAEFGCNRHTIRRALDLLEQEHLVTRHQGRGTYVVDEIPNSIRKTQLTIGLIDISHALGARPPAKLLSVNVQPASEVAAKLDIAEETLVTHIHRVRLINDQPAIVENIYIPYPTAPNLTDFDLSLSLRGLMRQQFNLHLTRSEIIFESIISSGYISEILEIPIGSAVMLEKRTSINSENMPSEYSEHIYRGDRFAFVLK